VSDNGSLAYLSRVAATNSEVDVPGMSHLTWLDRSGRSLAVLDKPAIYLHAALSPDQSRIAADIQDQQGNWDVWVLDSARANTNRLTSGHSTTWYPAWSPDGTYIAYSSASAGDLQLFRKLASGAGQEEILSQSSLAKFCNDWSPDGRYLLYSQIDPKSFSDIWVLPLTGERKSFPFLQTQFDERDGKFSPDGQWIAYVADELSGYEVWVQSFPAGKGKWQISTSGGIAPCWRRDGRELYYLSSDGKLMAVDVKPGPSFQAGAPHALFETHGAGQFAAAADGRKFLLTIPAERTAEEPVHVMLNWTAVSKK
jgi:Tol biopolymer transport system component